MTPKKKKKQILFSFDEEILLQLRKRLFPKGVSLQEFFTCIAERAVLHTTDFEDLLNKAQETKLNKIKEGDEEAHQISEENLYDLFEETLNKKQSKLKG